MEKPLNSSSHKTRRQFLQASASAIATITVSGVLSSCRRTYSDVQVGTSPSPAAANSNTLSIFTWAGYTDDELLRSFEQATGIKVVADIFDSNESMLAKVQAGGANQYSVLYPSDYMVREMNALGLLQTIDKSKVKGVEGLLPRFQNPTYDPDNNHSIPANWGTTGLIYNPEKVSPGPTDWQSLWDNKAKLSRRLTLFNDVREVMGATLRSLGHSYNATDPKEIEAAYNKLRQLKPAISNFTTDGWRDQLLSGDLAVAMAYSSDAIAVIAENPRLKYVIPRSGSSLWTDTMAIPKTAPNAEAAYAWINFMLDPANAARTAERLKLATASQAAIALMPESLQKNTSLFPNQTIINKCESIAPVGTATDLYDRYWTQLTSV